ncbi:glycosyltransferase [Chloroflexota bacterium]
MTQVAILGAGAAGLSTAWLLKQHGIDFVVLEKQAYVGGLARSFDWHGFSCDFAAHRLFTTNDHILQQLLNLVPMGRHVRRSRIYLRAHWMRDPLDVLELSLNLSITEKIRTVWTYLARPRNLPENNFENYVVRRYGRALYQYFFQPYTEKLFGIRGDQISVLWARQKVRLANPLDNLRENTKTKFQYFYYPVRGGYGAITDRLYQEVQANVVTNAKVTGLENQDGEIKFVSYVKDGEKHTLQTDMVVSTLPMSLTAGLLNYKLELAYRKVDAVYVLLNKPLASDYHWIYFMDSDIAINRLVEFKNMSPVDKPVEQTVLCAEVTQEHDNVVERVIDDLVKVGLVKRSDILDTNTRRENFAYPVYGQDYEQNLEKAGVFFSQYKNLHLVGRAAEFRHREVDDNFEAAIEVVEYIRDQLPDGRQTMETKIMEEKSAKPIISAVLLTYNNYDDTHECLQSLQETNYPHLDIYLVDNGSQDQTPKKVRSNFPNVQVIENKQNLGVPAGYNVGFESALKAGADYILMLNNDTVISPAMIDELLVKAEADPRAGIIMPKILYYGSEDEVWSSGARYRNFPPSIKFDDPHSHADETIRLIEYAPSCGLLIHRRAFQVAGLFDPGYFFWFDDWDFSERVRAHGLNIWYVPNARMWHKVSRTIQGPRSPLFWHTFGASITRFYRRHGRPAWFSVLIHVGYVMLREFLWKRNWAYLGHFWKGVQEGLQKPLGNYPLINK